MGKPSATDSKTGVDPLHQIDAGSQGVLGSGSNPDVGRFRAVGSPSVDDWRWTIKAFPGNGFTIQFVKSLPSFEPTQVYPAYAFSDTTSSVVRQWSTSEFFRIVRGSTLLGWFESSAATPPQLMWWSTGVGLTAGRVLAISPGDLLEFIPSSPPSSTSAYPLTTVQTAL